MRSRRPVIIIVGFVAFVLLGFLSDALRAEPPTDEQISSILANVQQFYQESRGQLDEAKFNTFIDEQLTDVEITELSAGQIEMLLGLLTRSPERMEATKARLGVLAADPGRDGAVAAILLFQGALFSQADVEDQKAALEQVLAHPGLAAAIADGSGAGLFDFIGYVDAAALAGLEPQLLAIGEMIDDQMPAAVLVGTRGYMSALIKLGSAVDPGQREKIRLRMVDAFTKAAPKERESGDPRLADYLDRCVTYLEGAYMRGQLMDHAAPKLTFTWVSGDEKIATLADLKGKVVVLDFWATWCGPCVATFPQVAELQKRYEGYEVAIVGVTSLQGNHYPGGAPPISTEGDPQREYELMAEFMNEKDMSWTVAFAEQDVFNPDFGVEGIPHVAVIDPSGTVRYNGLHPGSPLAEKAEKIDALLAKAGLPVPPAP